MKIQDFLALSVGKWFAQRTCYLLQSEEAENRKAEMTIETLNPSAPEVAQLCQPQGVSPEQTLGGLKMSWDNSVDWGKPKEQGSAILVFAPHADNPAQGKVLRHFGVKQAHAPEATYTLGDDGVLTLEMELPNQEGVMEERQWFASDNLRLRTTVVIQNGKCTQTTFYSEIRKMVAPPKENTETAVAQV